MTAAVSPVRRRLLGHTAITLSGSGRFVLENVPTRKPGADEISVSPLRVGICGTDRDIARRVRADHARILGHEGIAEVVEVGPQVAGFSVGQRVVFNPVNPGDQADILGHSVDGLLQERFLASARDLRRGLVVPLDSGVPLLCGPLVEPLGTVIYGQRLVDTVTRQECIVIVGAGPIGLLHVLHARSRGCARVVLVDSSRARLAWAVERGIVADHEVLVDSSSLPGHVRDRTAGRGVDSVYLCTTRSSAAAALGRALEYLRAGGCIDLVVGFPDGLDVPELPGVELNDIRRANVCGLPADDGVRSCVTAAGKDVRLTGHRGTSKEHLAEAMTLLAREPDRYTRTIAQIVPRPLAPALLQQLVAQRAGQDDNAIFGKVLIDMTAES